MDIQQLKMIIEAVNGLGVNAKEAFVLWLLFQNAGTWVFGIIWSVIGGVSIYQLLGFLRSLWTLNQIARAAGTILPFTKSEVEHICKIVSENMKR